MLWNASQTKRAVGIVRGIDKARGKIKVAIIDEREFAPIDMDETMPSDLFTIERVGFSGHRIRRIADGVVVVDNIKGGRPAAEEEMRQLRITHGPAQGNGWPPPRPSAQKKDRLATVPRSSDLCSRLCRHRAVTMQYLLRWIEGTKEVEKLFSHIIKKTEYPTQDEAYGPKHKASHRTLTVPRVGEQWSKK